jgi:DNA (cytosine-5)-methyltransferase 1
VQRRDPIGDPRNDLIFEFLRLVEGVRPAFFLMENVEGLKGRRSGRYLKLFLAKAAELGYYCQWRVLDAVEYGIPQFRKRLFVIGELSGLDSGHFVFPEPTHRPEQWLTVNDAIGDLPPPPDDHTEHSQWPNHRRTRMSPLNIRRISFVSAGGGWEQIPEDLRLRCHQPGAARIGHRYVYGRMSWDKPAPSLTARFDSFTRGKFAHPSDNRSITLREGARIQTFPDDFGFEGTQEEIASQIGNAIPPRLAMVLGRALLEALERRMQRGENTAKHKQLVLIR